MGERNHFTRQQITRSNRSSYKIWNSCRVKSFAFKSQFIRTAAPLSMLLKKDINHNGRFLFPSVQNSSLIRPIEKKCFGDKMGRFDPMACLTGSQCSWWSTVYHLGACKTTRAALFLDTLKLVDVAGGSAVEQSVAVVESWILTGPGYRLASVRVPSSAGDVCGGWPGGMVIARSLYSWHVLVEGKAPIDPKTPLVPSYHQPQADRRWLRTRLTQLRPQLAVGGTCRPPVLLICPDWTAVRSACSTVWHQHRVPPLFQHPWLFHDPKMKIHDLSAQHFQVNDIRLMNA